MEKNNIDESQALFTTLKEGVTSSIQEIGGSMSNFLKSKREGIKNQISLDMEKRERAIQKDRT